MPETICPLPLPRETCELGDPPAGWEYSPTPQDNYRLAEGDRHCSALRCPHKAVAILTRHAYVRGLGLRGRDYGYCGCHLGRYGAWIQDGQVVRWQLRKVTTDG